MHPRAMVETLKSDRPSVRCSMVATFPLCQTATVATVALENRFSTPSEADFYTSDHAVKLPSADPGAAAALPVSQALLPVHRRPLTRAGRRDVQHARVGPLEQRSRRSRGGYGSSHHGLALAETERCGAGRGTAATSRGALGGV